MKTRPFTSIRLGIAWLLIAMMTINLGGCAGTRKNQAISDVSANNDYSDYATSIPAVANSQPAEPVSFDGAPEAHLGYPQFDDAPQFDSRPLTIRSKFPENFQELTLNEAIQIAMSNAEVIRSLGGQIIQNPAGVATAYDVEIQESNPFFGEAAALSQYDPSFQLNSTYQENDDVFNNFLLGGGANEVQQNLFNWNYSLSKIGRAGTQYTLSGLTQHDNNNATQNVFDHSWTQALEASIRQPLLQGAGIQFNDLAGPQSGIGLRNSNGIVLARLNTNISQAQFERRVRDFVRELAAAYWRLYFSYRSYEAAKQAHESSQELYDTVKARFENDLPGGEADREGLARGRLIQLETQMMMAVSGDGGNSLGIYQADSDLRRLMGQTISETGAVYRPIDEPSDVELPYAWEQLVESAMTNRVEIQEQELRVDQRQKEVLVAKNFTLPRLDAVALWRNNGFGDDRFGNGTIPNTADQRFASSQKNFWAFSHQEWEFNVQFAMPLGRRLQFDALRNAEVALRKENVLLADLQHEIKYALEKALRNFDSAYYKLTMAKDQLRAAEDTFNARVALFKIDKISIDDLITSQQNLLDAQTNKFQQLTEYETARIQVQLERGTLVEDLTGVR